MREIKFRGYDDEREEWRIGGLDRDLEQKRYYITDEYEGIGREVLQRTIGQYTGLHDKNGKEIYEGDILKVTHKGEEYIGKVIYEYNEFILDVMNMNRNYGRVCLDILERYIKVIGNIYDNPELLERSSND